MDKLFTHDGVRPVPGNLFTLSVVGVNGEGLLQNEGLLESRFYYWQRRVKRLLPERGGFIPVIMEKPSSFSAAGNETKVVLAAKLPGNPQAE